MAPRPAVVSASRPTYRLHVRAWLRRPVGAVLLPGWLAITLGHDIFSWRALDPVELAHEIEHVRQWDRFGVTFAARYMQASFRSWRTGSGWHLGNRFEVAARAAAEREAAAREAAAPEAAAPEAR